MYWEVLKSVIFVKLLNFFIFMYLKIVSLQLLSDPTVIKIAGYHNKTCAQVLLRWAVQHGMSKQLY